MKKAYVLLFDGYADWELGHVLAELRRIGNLTVAAAGFSMAPVLSMGGLRVLPDMLLSDIDPGDVRIFLLPGGEMWEKEYPEDEVHGLLRTLDGLGTPIGAVCAATTVLARAGLLKGRAHTSNSPAYLLSKAPGYGGEDGYAEEMAVTDGHITTASGLGSVDFTMKILETLDIATPDLRALWYRAFRHGEFPEGFGQE